MALTTCRSDARISMLDGQDCQTSEPAIRAFVCVRFRTDHALVEAVPLSLKGTDAHDDCSLSSAHMGGTSESDNKKTKVGNMEDEVMSEKRDAYLAKITAKLNEWNDTIDALQAKAETAKADVKSQYQQQIESLRAKRADLGHRIEQVREAGDRAWNDLRTGIESARKAMDDAVHSAKKRLM